MFFFDPPVYALLNANAQTWPVSIEVARLASNWLPGLGIGAVLLAFWRSTPALRRTLVLLLLSMALAWCVARLIRWGFPMPRPPQLGMGMQWIHHSASASFPSMHASGAFALAQAVSLGCTRHRRALVWLAWGAALLITWSRVHLGVHFPSDVLGGAVVGSCSALIVWQLYYRLRRLLRGRRQQR